MANFIPIRQKKKNNINNNNKTCSDIGSLVIDPQKQQNK